MRALGYRDDFTDPRAIRVHLHPELFFLRVLELWSGLPQADRRRRLERDVSLTPLA